MLGLIHNANNKRQLCSRCSCVQAALKNEPLVQGYAKIIRKSRGVFRLLLTFLFVRTESSEKLLNSTSLERLRLKEINRSSNRFTLPPFLYCYAIVTVLIEGDKYIEI